MLPRSSLFASLQAALARAPVVALLGPRQCGKNTLARQLVPVASANYFDLEDPISPARNGGHRRGAAATGAVADPAGAGRQN